MKLEITIRIRASDVNLREAQNLFDDAVKANEPFNNTMTAYLTDPNGDKVLLADTGYKEGE